VLGAAFSFASGAALGVSSAPAAPRLGFWFELRPTAPVVALLALRCQGVGVQLQLASHAATSLVSALQAHGVADRQRLLTRPNSAVVVASGDQPDVRSTAQIHT
jgi:hypothetical protein